MFDGYDPLVKGNGRPESIDELSALRSIYEQTRLEKMIRTVRRHLLLDRGLPHGIDGRIAHESGPDPGCHLHGHASSGILMRLWLLLVRCLSVLIGIAVEIGLLVWRSSSILSLLECLGVRAIKEISSCLLLLLLLLGREGRRIKVVREVHVEDEGFPILVLLLVVCWSV
jgi:hypothetical protein